MWNMLNKVMNVKIIYLRLSQDRIIERNTYCKEWKYSMEISTFKIVL